MFAARNDPGTWPPLYSFTVRTSTTTENRPLIQRSYASAGSSVTKPWHMPQLRSKQEIRENS